LATRAREGDDVALAELVEKAAPVVRRWALVQTNDAADADDLTQDVLMRIVQRHENLPEPERFGAWLYRVTRNAATDRLRRRARRRDAVQFEGGPDTFVSSSPDPVQDAARGELRSRLDALFRELPRRQREVFDLVELSGIPAVEAAAILDIRPASVRANLLKARRKLRRRILEDWPDVAEDWQ